MSSFYKKLSLTRRRNLPRVLSDKMPDHPAQLDVDRLLVDCEVTRTRGTGPGGQHRNKVETAMVVKHLPTGILGQASERRSQEANREMAVFRLRLNLAIQFRSKSTRELSDTWKSRCRGSKINVNPQHKDFPSLLAEALDTLHDEEFDFGSTSSRLGISKSQLIKFLKIVPDVMIMCNEARHQRGLHRLK